MGTTATSSVGLHDERASALTVLLPLKRWGRFWLRVLCWWVRQPWRRDAFEQADQLRFIYAIRWTLLPPLVPGPFRVHTPRDERWQLLFESNFDGDWDEYLDEFGAILSKPLGRILVACLGFPGFEPISIFKAYAKVHDHVPEHYCSAYPSLTAIDIREALAVRVRGSRTRVLNEGYGRESPCWATYLVPLDPARTTEAVLAARALTLPNPPSAASTSIHFARATVIDRPSGSWLLLTILHDHHDRRTLVEGILDDDPPNAADPDATPNPRPLHRLLACADGLPESASEEDLADYLLACEPASVRHTLQYCAYPGWTAGEIAGLADTRTASGWPAHEVDV